MSMDKSGGEETELTEEENDGRSVGKLQDVALFGIAVEPEYLIIPGHHVKPI